MCEFLVMKNEHWMDSLDSKELQERISANPNLADKYNRRYKKGDFIECKEDGHFKNGYDKNAFDLVILQGVSVEDGKYLIESEYNGEDQIKRRRYNINSDIIVERLISGKMLKSITPEIMETLTTDKKENVLLSEKNAAVIK